MVQISFLALMGITVPIKNKTFGHMQDFKLMSSFLGILQSQIFNINTKFKEKNVTRTKLQDKVKLTFLQNEL